MVALITDEEMSSQGGRASVCHDMKKVAVEKEAVERENKERDIDWKSRKVGFWPTFDSIFFMLRP